MQRSGAMAVKIRRSLWKADRRQSLKLIRRDFLAALRACPLTQNVSRDSGSINAGRELLVESALAPRRVEPCTQCERCRVRADLIAHLIAHLIARSPKKRFSS